jgi:hypothetical protein
VKPDPDRGDHAVLTRTPIRAYFIKFGQAIESIPEKVIDEIKYLEESNLLNPGDQNHVFYEPGMEIRMTLNHIQVPAIIIRLINHAKVLVDTTFCRVTVPIGAIAMPEEKRPASG